MDYYQKDFMIKLGETSSGDIIEVPDLMIYGLAFTALFVLLILSMESKN